MFEDKTLVCKECGQEFVFSAREQEFYEEKGFANEPQRCKPCRDKRKQAARGPREMHDATCAACGGIAQVPFIPRDDRPVYCSECFAKIRSESAQEAAPETPEATPEQAPEAAVEDAPEVSEAE